MRKDAREFIRGLEAVRLTVECDAGALPRAARWQAASEGEWDALHAALLARHDPLASIRDHRATQARDRRLAHRRPSAQLPVEDRKPKAGVPQSVRDTAEYPAENDSLYDSLEERCQLTRNAWAPERESV